MAFSFMPHLWFMTNIKASIEDTFLILFELRSIIWPRKWKLKYNMRTHLEKCSIGLLRSIFETLNCSLELDKWWLQFYVGLWGYKAIMCMVRNEWEIDWFMANLLTYDYYCYRELNFYILSHFFNISLIHSKTLSTQI